MEPNNDQVDKVFGRSRPLLFAHRGGGLEAPESTERAFRHAIKVAKADVLEIDIQAVPNSQGDLKMIVWHGPGLDNVRIDLKKGHERPAEIQDCTWEELEGRAWVAPPGWVGPLAEVPREDETRLMTLRQLLDLLRKELDEAAGFTVGLNIELKTDTFKLGDQSDDKDPVKTVVGMLKSEIEATGRKILVVSQNESLLDYVRKLAKNENLDLARGLSFWEALNPEDLDKDENRGEDEVWRNRALQTFWFPFASSRDRVKHIGERKGTTHVFITEPLGLDHEPHWPTEKSLFRLFRRGIDGVMTDRPARVREMIERWRAPANGNGSRQPKPEYSAGDWFGDWKEFFLRVLDWVWELIKITWTGVKPARVSLIAVAAVGAALIGLDQGQDMLIGFAEGLSLLRWLGFVAGSLWIAWSCWYSARVAVSMRSPGGPTAKLAPLRRQLPRVLGLLVFVLMSVATLRAAVRVAPGWPADAAYALQGIVALFLAMLQLGVFKLAPRKRHSRSATLVHAILFAGLLLSSFCAVPGAVLSPLAAHRGWIWVLLFVVQVLLFVIGFRQANLKREAVATHALLFGGYTLAPLLSAPLFILFALNGLLTYITVRKSKRRLIFFGHLIAVVMLLAGCFAVEVRSDTETVIRLLLLSLICSVLGQLFYWTVLCRRDWWRSLWKKATLARTPELELAGFREINLRAVPAMGLSFLVGLGTFIVGWQHPSLASDLGPAPTLFLGVAAWMPFFTLATMVSRQQTFPVLGALLVASILLSDCGDNHILRLHPRDASDSIGSRPTLSEACDLWLDARLRDDGSGPVPCIIVATEGGGSIAAYWTATVLGHLQDARPNFREHLLAISSVSGGSVGAVSFRALLEEPAAKNHVKQLGQEFTGADYLSPQLVNALTVDFLSRFPFVSLLELRDRAWALEHSRETTWRSLSDSKDCEGLTSDRLAKPFLDLWADNNKRPWPALFLNATSVETGRRIIVSNLSLRDARSPHDDVHDLLSDLDHDLRASTAAGVTARFPLISPPATLQKPKEEKPLGHAVDGGYFENLGATTALEVVRTLHRTLEEWDTWGCEHQRLARRVKPIVIQITSSPKLPDHVGELGPRDEYEAEALRFGVELRSPPKALLETRDARGVLATARLHRAVETQAVEGGERGAYYHLRMYDGAFVPPLGRILSGKAKKTIKGYLGEQSNSCAIDDINEALAWPGENR